MFLLTGPSGPMTEQNHPGSEACRKASWGTRLLNWGFRGYVRRFIRRNFHAVRAPGLENLASLPVGPAVGFPESPGLVGPDDRGPDDRSPLPRPAASPPRWTPRPSSPVPGPGADGILSGGSRLRRRHPDFLRTSRALLRSPSTLLWLTPAGPVSGCPRADPVPERIRRDLIDREYAGGLFAMAVEYPFWNERHPELLVAFSSPVDCHSLPEDRDDRSRFLETTLAETQATLARHAIARDPRAFATLSTGSSGIPAWLYDVWRRVVAGLRGRTIPARTRGPRFPRPL